MLDQKIIRLNNSPLSAPISNSPKKIGCRRGETLEVLIDFRGLNQKTIDYKYPLPNITDLLDKLGKCQYYT